MKTVLDAVIATRASLDKGTISVFIRKEDKLVFCAGTINKLSGGYSGTCADSGHEWHVLNEYWDKVGSGEFNALVGELASNFGKCDISYQKHCSNEVTRLEGNEMKTINWNEAPKEATHHGEFENHECWYQVKGDEVFSWNTGALNDTCVWNDTCWKSEQLTANNEGNVTFTPRLKVKPVYTQQQSVLMEESLKCIIDHLSEYGTCGVNSNVKNGYDAPNIDSFKEPQQRAKWVARNALGLLNLEPPVELVDGECYQFDYDGGEEFGRYRSSLALFCTGSNAYSAKYCTNIKPLTVA